VWWLVSPQNPLKAAKGMAPFAARLAGAAAFVARHRRIVVSDVEAKLGTTFTADTIAALRGRYPRWRFVWLMGGDNLIQLPRWRRWTDIVESVPIAVFDRPATAHGALAGIAAHRYMRARVADDAARGLAQLPAPAWAFFHTRLDPRSATEIRAKRAAQPRKKPPAEAAPKASVTALPARRRRVKVEPASEPNMLSRIIASLEDGKAENIVTIDLAGKTQIADYMVVASGRSARQVTALTEHLLETLPRKWRTSVEGKAQGDWVLIDAGDVIIHLFRPEIRAYYNLEKMWGAEFPGAEAAGA
jgi:nicotinate-nucleotide adenylyltransferase